MTAILGGAPDFQSQTAQSLRFLKTQVIDTMANVSVDISGLVGPNDQGVAVFWKGLAGWAGLPCNMTVQTNLPSFAVQPMTRIADATYAVVPLFGALFTSGSVSGISVILTVPTDIGGEMTGQVFIFAITGPPAFIPTIRRSAIGQGSSSGAVSVAAGATTPILGIPPPGQYYRLKLLSWSHSGVPGGTTAPQWLRTDSGTVIATTEDTATGGNQSNIPLDLQFDFGVSFHNPGTIAISACIAYELWFV